MEDSYYENPKIKVVTYNLYECDEVTAKEFTEQVISKKANVVAVQGVTKLNCDALFRTFKSNGYRYARFDQISTLKDRDTFEIIFSNLPILKKEFQPFTSLGDGPGRGLSKYLVRVGSEKERPKLVWVVTSELEDKSTGVRKAQVKEIDNHLRDLPKTWEEELVYGVIFAGDTNIPRWQDRDLGAPKGWYDAWKEKGTSENELTSEEDRFDQIWWYNFDVNSSIKCLEFGFIHELEIYGLFEI